MSPSTSYTFRLNNNLMTRISASYLILIAKHHLLKPTNYHLAMLLYFKTSLGNFSQSVNLYEWCAMFLLFIPNQTLGLLASNVSVGVGRFPWKIRSFLAFQINQIIPCHNIIHSYFLLTRLVFAKCIISPSMLSAFSMSSSSHSWILVQIAAANLHLWNKWIVFSSSCESHWQQTTESSAFKIFLLSKFGLVAILLSLWAKPLWSPMNTNQIRPALACFQSFCFVNCYLSVSILSSILIPCCLDPISHVCTMRNNI